MKIIRDGRGYCGTHDPGEDTGERVYSINAYRLEVVELIVVKRTASQLVIKLDGGGTTKRHPDEVSPTPQAAWERFLEIQQKRYDKAEQDLKEQREFLDRAKAKAKADQQEESPK